MLSGPRLLMPNDDANHPTLAATELDLRRLRRAHVEEVVGKLGPDAAWLRLGISRATLYRWLRRWRAEDAIAATAARGGDLR
jgi:transposase